MLIDDFKKAIDCKLKVVIVFDSFEKGIIRRKCIPFDYGPSNRSKDGKNRYHFLDLDSPNGKHVLSILPEQIKKLDLLDETFNPENYVTWVPNWHLSRDWGNVS